MLFNFDGDYVVDAEQSIYDHTRHYSAFSLATYLEPLLLTLINFNPNM